jgi:hypothetical protein
MATRGKAAKKAKGQSKTAAKKSSARILLPSGVKDDEKKGAPKKAASKKSPARKPGK